MKKCSVLLFAFALCSCFAATPDSRFYLLESGRENQVVSNKKINIAVQDILVPEYLDRPQIVLQNPAHPELTISEFDRWAADLNTMLQTTLINNLQQALPKAVIKPLVYGDEPRYIVKINIEKFSGSLDGNAYLQGSWQILSGHGRLLKEQDFEMAVPAGKDYNSYVAAQSDLWAEMAQKVASKIISL